MHPFGITLIGITGTNARKLLATVILIVAALLLKAVIRTISRLLLHRQQGGPERARFWVRQVTGILIAIVIVLGTVAIWFDNPGRLATAAGLISAGIAIALQRVITSFAAYLIILRGRIFTVGDRITIAGVRGDVMALGFVQTTVMEMGEPPGEQPDPPATWVRARQYTGRLVRVTNDRIFDAPVYNYTREFPYLWEEMHIPVKYGGQRQQAEEILLDVARKHTTPLVERAKPAYDELRRTYFIPDSVEFAPRVFYRLTDNWVELSLRFVAEPRGVRALKDAMSRDILVAFEKAKIEIASGTYEIVGVPPLEVHVAPQAAPRPQ